MVFLDNASTTKMHHSLSELLLKYNEVEYFNAGALYKSSTKIANDISIARKKIISCLGGRLGDNFVFTSGATEANNLALAVAKRFRKGKILLSSGEHPSMYNTALELKNQGFDVDFVALNNTGNIDENDFRNKMSNDVCFVSIMHVSNETGAINNIQKLVKFAKNINKNVIFHCDGVQAYGKLDVNVTSLGVDMYTITAHKIHGPKGIGGLYVKSGLNLRPQVFGGGQENGLRSGTENVAGIIAFAEAVKLAKDNQKNNYEYITNLKNVLLDELNKLQYKPILVSDERCSPYVVSLLCKNLRGETLLHKLDDEGFMVGNGSACSTKKRGNRVLGESGYAENEIEGALRISFSECNTTKEIIDFVHAFDKVVKEYKEGTGR